MKTHQLEGSVKSINDKVRFECSVEVQPPIFVDYIPPFGGGEGYTSLELLLLSLATCFGSSIKFLLARKPQVKVASFEVHASGLRRTDHPTSFSKIILQVKLQATELPSDSLEEVLRQAEAICPVWDMLKNNVEIHREYQLLG